MDTTILALGRLSSEFPDVEYVIVGEGDDRPRLEELAAVSGVRERVHFRGEVQTTELLALYQACEVMVLPSRREGFGLVFLEAMAFAKPVVGGAHGATPELVQDGITGFLVPHGDVEALTGILRRVLSDEALRFEMGRRGMERVQSRYLFEHFRARLCAVIDELADRDGCRSPLLRRPNSAVEGSQVSLPARDR